MGEILMIHKEDIKRVNEKDFDELEKNHQKGGGRKKTQHTKRRVKKTTHTEIRITLVKVDGQTFRLRLKDRSRPTPTES